MEAVITTIPNLLSSADVDIDRVLLLAEWLLRDVVSVGDILPPQHGTELVGFVSEIVAGIQTKVDQRRLTRRRGRLFVHIRQDQLEMLLVHRFSIVHISHNMMSVSARTSRRRILEYGLESSAAYSTLTDNQLDEITVHNISFSHTNWLLLRPAIGCFAFPAHASVSSDHTPLITRTRYLPVIISYRPSFSLRSASGVLRQPGELVTTHFAHS